MEDYKIVEIVPRDSDVGIKLTKIVSSKAPKDFVILKLNDRFGYVVGVEVPLYEFREYALDPQTEKLLKLFPYKDEG